MKGNSKSAVQRLCWFIALLCSALACAGQVPTAGMKLWLAADAGVVTDEYGQVTQWQDQSGCGNHAVGDVGNLYWQGPSVASTGINGRAALRFYSSYWLNLPGVVTGAAQAEMFIVIKKDNAEGSGSFGTILGETAEYPLRDNSGGVYSTVGKPLQDVSRPVIHNVSVSEDQKVVRFNAIEQLVVSTGQTGGDVVASFDEEEDEGSFLVFPSYGRINSSFEGLIAEIIVYDRVLSPQERTAVVAYLQDRYTTIRPPLTPTAMEATGDMLGSVLLRWQPGDQQQCRYEVQRLSPDSGEYVTVATGLAAELFRDRDVTSGTYAYRVRTINGLGQPSDYSSPVSVVYSASIGSSLPGEGLVWWLRSDRGVVLENKDGVDYVIQWKDQSPSGNHAIGEWAQYWSGASRPPKFVSSGPSSNPEIDFSFSETSPDDPGAVRTQQPLPATSSGEYFVISRRLGCVGRNRIGLIGDLFNNNNYIDGKSGSLQECSAEKSYIGRPVQDLFQLNILNVEVGPESKVVRINGCEVTRHKFGPEEIPGFSSSNACLGMSSYTDSCGYGYAPFGGVIQEVVVYDRALSSDERTAVLLYLQKRYSTITGAAAPVSVECETLLAGGIGLYWKPGAAQQVIFEVERKRADEADYTRVGPDLSEPRFLDPTAVSGYSYTYRVRARNALGDFSTYSYSPVVNFAPIAPPVPVSELALWLRSDSGVRINGEGDSVYVTRWLDQSVQGNDALAAVGAKGPAYVASAFGGKAGIHFVGESCGLSLRPIMSGAMGGDLFIVLKRDQGVTSQGTYGVFHDWHNNWISPNGEIRDDLFGQTADVQARGALTDAHIYNTAGGEAERGLWLNGVRRWTYPEGVWNRIESRGMLLGQGSYDSVLSGTIAEVLLYTRMLSQEERASITAYLNERYNILPEPPSITDLIVEQSLFGGGVTLRWTSVQGQEVFYQIERKAADESVFQTIGSSDDSVFTDLSIEAGKTYSYRVVAVNGVGGRSAQAPVSEIDTSTVPAPIPTGGIRCWLRSDRGVVVEPVGGSNYVRRWLDQGPYALNANSEASTYGSPCVAVPAAANGYPAVLFSPSSRSLQLGNVFAGAETSGEYFAVLKANRKASDYVSLALHYSHNATYQGSDSFLRSNTCEIPKCIGDETWAVYNASSENNYWAVSINGVAQYEDVKNSVSNPSGAGRIYGSNGSVAELIVYDHRLTDEERTQVLLYLQNRYATVVVPQPPLGLQAYTNAVTPTVELRWLAGAVESVNFEVQRKGPADESFSVIGERSINRTFIDTTAVPGNTYSYRVKAINGLGVSSSFSEEVNVAIGMATTSIPTAGIRLWLKADAGVMTNSSGYVTEWMDSSGARHHVLARDKTAQNCAKMVSDAIAGRPSLRFFGSEGLIINDVFSGATSGDIFVYHRKEGTVASADQWAVANYGRYLWSFQTSYPAQDGMVHDSLLRNYPDAVFTPTQPVFEYHLYNISSGTDWVARINGSEQFRDASVRAPSAFSSLTLGGHDYYRRCVGDIAEVIIYDRVLDDAERKQVEDYLFNKYAQGVIAPSFTPGPGLYSGSVNVGLSSSQTADEIYYTMDGSDPVIGIASRYASPIVVAGKSALIKAVAVRNGTMSKVAGALYTIGVPPAVPTNTSGLAATYYQGADFDGTSHKRIDPVIQSPRSSGSWNYVSMPAGTKSAVWTGSVVAQLNEEYTFYVRAGGRTKLWLGGSLLLDSNDQTGLAERSANIRLAAGQTYPVRIEYVGVDANYREYFELFWSSLSIPKEIVPTRQLVSGMPFYSTVDTPTATPPAGTFGDSVSVALSSSANGTPRIFYTLNGSEPTKSSTYYTGPITLRSNTTLKAMAYALNNNDSGLLVANYTLDNVGPTLSNLRFNGQPIGGALTADGAFSVDAVDSTGVKNVEFKLDGASIGIDDGDWDGFTARFLVDAVTDGNHVLTVQAWDRVGTPSEVLSVPITVAKAPPAAPTITEPANGRRVNKSALTVRGTAEKGSSVSIYRGSELLATTQAGTDGTFVADVVLLAGDNTLSAVAKNRNVVPSAPSSPVVVTYDNTVPGAPTALTARARSSGQIQLSWFAPSGGVVSGYYLFRSENPIPDTAAFSPANAIGGLLRDLSYTDTPPADGRYYYRAVAAYLVGQDATLSVPSNQADASSDRTPPTASVSVRAMGPLFDQSGRRFGRGLAEATVTLSEPLAATPFLNLSTAGGAPIFVDLSASSDTSYVGVFAIESSTHSGPVTPVFSAFDKAGNKGTQVALSAPVVIDTEGPVVVGLSPVVLDSQGHPQPSPEFTSVKNEPVAPETAVILRWLVTLSEPPKPGSVPSFTAALSEQPSVTVAASVTDAGDADPRTWLLAVTLPAVAGNEPENLTLACALLDDLDNAGSEIQPAHVFQVYKGALPPLAVPDGLSAQALPAGAVRIRWNAVERAAAYVLQVKGPADAGFADLEVLTAVENEYVYTPAIDGDHSYRVASVRHENGQESTSGWSSIASARADRVPPPPPVALQLSVVAQGLRCAWQAPAVGLSDVASFALYRGPTALSTVEGLTPIVGGIARTALQTVDARPNGTEPHYALVAIDQAGNRSALLTGFANIALLPVRSLAVAQTGVDAPVLTWQPAPGSILDGYELSIDGAVVQQGAGSLLPVSMLSYTDSAYTRGDRRYTIRAMSGPEGVARSVVLPKVVLTLAASEIKRGLMNSLVVRIQNQSTAPIVDAAVRVRVAGRNHFAAASVGVAPGAEASVPVVVGGYEDLPSGEVPVELTLIDTPNEGETVTVSRAASAQVAEGALTAEILPGDFVRGGLGEVRLKLVNPSPLPIEFKVARQNRSLPSDEVRFKVLDGQGGLLSNTPVKLTLGDNIVTLANGTTVVRVPGNSTYVSPVISLPVPLAAPAAIAVSLEIDSVYYDFGEAATQVKLKGPRAQTSVSTVETSYTAEITSVTPQESSGTTPITITGRALLRGVDPAFPSARAVGVPVVVYVSVAGFVRQETVLSDATGGFSYVFEPGVAEKGGVYQVWASHPDITAPAENPNTFTIRSVVVTPLVMNFRAPRNYRQVLPVQVSTGAGTSLQNLRAVLVGSIPSAMSVVATPVPAVAPEQRISLPLSITGLASDSTAQDLGSLSFRVVSDDPQGGEYVWATLTVNYEFTEAKPYIQATPNLVTLGVQPTQASSETVELKNQGFGPLENATISLVSADQTALPDWIRLQTPSSLGTVDVGASKSVVIAAAPPEEGLVVDQVYHLYLRVEGAGVPAQDFPVSVTVSPAGTGQVLLKLVDPYFQMTLPDGVANPAFDGVPGASVVLEKESTTGIATVTRGATSNASGEVSFGDLPSGRYKLRISANNHQPHISRITVKPGVTYAEQIALAYNAVTVSWSVVPVTFQDRYEVVLTATYETNVPVPVVVAEPSSVVLPDMCAGQVLTGEFRLTNHGLITADNVQVPLPKSDEYFSYELLTTFGNQIKAKQSVKVGYKIKCLKPLPGVCPDVVASHQSSRSQGVLLAQNVGMGGAEPGNAACASYGWTFPFPYDYDCLNGIKGTGQATFGATKTYGSCGGSSSAGPAVWTSYGGSGSGSSNIGWGGRGGTTDSSDRCYPKPDHDCSPGNSGGGDGGAGDKCDKEKEKPPTRDDCGGRNSAGGSWTDVVTRQFRDKATDLDIPVANGSVSLWRDFSSRRWRFRLVDDLWAVCASGSGNCMLVLNDQPFQKTTTRADASGSAKITAASEAPAGIYLLHGVGPEKIIKNSDGSFAWSDDRGHQRLFDASGRMTQRLRYGLLVSSYSYNAAGELTTVADCDGNTVLTLTYTDGRLTGAKDLADRTVSYTYDVEGRLTTVTDVESNVTTYGYDNWWHLTTKRTHLNGANPDEDHIVTIGYDVFASTATPVTPPLRVIPGNSALSDTLRGQVLSMSHNNGEKKSFTYKYNSADGTYYVRTTTGAGVQTEQIFNSDGVLISETLNGEPVYKMEQDARTRVTLRGGQRTTEEYNDRGYLIRRVHPDGGTERFEYDLVANKISRHTDTAGVVTEYTFDAMGNLLTETQAVGTPLERKTTNEYYPNTRLLKTRTAADQTKTGYEYDTAGRLTREYDVADQTRQTRYTYTTLGQVETKTDAEGRVTTYLYDLHGHVTKEINALQEETLFTYEGENLIEVERGKTATTRGLISRYDYDAAGRRTAELRVDASGNEQVVKTFTYNLDGQLLSETNALGQATTYRYDSAGNRIVISVPGADGNRSETNSEYDSLGRVTSTTDAAKTRTTIEYDLENRPVLTIEAVGTPLARTTRSKYDSAGRLLEQSVSDGRDASPVYTTTNTYDVLGRRTAVGGNRAYAKSFTYDAADRVLTETDALNRVTAYTYNTAGLLESVKVNAQLVASYTYDRVGNRLSETDGEGNHRHYHYDALDRQTHESIALSASQAIPADWWTAPAFVFQETSYNPQGQTASVTRYGLAGATVVGATTSMTYDAYGRLSTQTEPSGLSRTYAYDAADNVIRIEYPAVASSGEAQPSAEVYLRSPHNAAVVDAVVDRAGNATHYTYDAALRVVAQTNSLAGTPRRTYDARGQVSTQTDAVNNTTSFEYDVLGQLVKTTHPDHVAGTHERVETMTYDSRGKLIEKAGAGGYPLVYRYDAVGNLLELQDGNGHVTRWTYTALNQVETKTYADSTTHSYTYNGAGRVATRRDAMGRTTSYSYDAYGQVTGVDYPTDADVSFVYDAYGRRLSMADGSGTTAWSYDAVGRTLSETQGSTHRTLTYQYDAHNQRTDLTITSSDSGVTPWVTSYGYDNAGRLRAVLDDRLPGSAPYTYSYHEKASLVAQITSPTGLKTVKAHDASGRLTSISGQRADGTVISSFSYTYNAAGQRDTEVGAEATRSFGYDAYRQLTQAVSKAGDTETARHEYAFDTIGNRLTSSFNLESGAQATSYTSNSVNQYTELAGTLADVPVYDNNGNTTSLQGSILRYDEENRLIEIEKGTERAAFIYDGFGRRVEKRTYANGVLAKTVRYVYDGWRVMEELDESYATTKSYTLGLDLSGSFEGAGGIGGLLAIAQKSGTNYTAATYFYDGNGNVTDLAADDGSSLAHYVYSPFGERITATGYWADSNPYQFSSKPREELSGFYYYGYRYYNPSSGRWLSRDPIEEQGGVNLYAMIANDAANRVDPLGLDYFFGGPGGAGAGQDSFGLVHPHPTPPNVPNWGQGAQNFSASAASMIQQLRQRLPGAEGGINVSWTFIWVPYPGGKWSVEASASGSVVACKYADGRAGLMADVTVEISTQAGFGYGAGGNQGFKRDRNGRLHDSRGRFAKNPEKGFGGVEGEGSRTSECKLCENSLDGSITIEVGGKAGAVLSVNPYANVSFAFSDPVSFDYGVRAGLSGYIGAELYLKASAEGSGTLIVK